MENPAKAEMLFYDYEGNPFARGLLRILGKPDRKEIEEIGRNEIAKRRVYVWFVDGKNKGLRVDYAPFNGKRPYRLTSRKSLDELEIETVSLTMPLEFSNFGRTVVEDFKYDYFFDRSQDYMTDAERDRFCPILGYAYWKGMPLLRGCLGAAIPKSGEEEHRNLLQRKIRVSRSDFLNDLNELVRSL